MKTKNTYKIKDFIIVNTHIRDIRSGDTILHNGQQRTVCEQNIVRGGFVGDAIFGDSYNSGYIMVKKVLFPKFYKGEFKGYF